MIKSKTAPILLALLAILPACSPRPVRPAAQTDAQAKAIAQCDYLYNQCMGKPGPTPSNVRDMDTVNMSHQPKSVCNQRLKECYESTLRPAP